MRGVAVIAAAACAMLAGAHSGRAAASTSIESFGFASSDTQAGGHPDLGLSFALDASESAEAAQTVAFSGPSGLVLEPTAVPLCERSQFAINSCPPSSQVGLVTVRGGHEANRDYLLGTAPVYELVREPGQFALLAFKIPTAELPVFVPVAEHGDPGSSELTFEDLPQSAPIASVHLSIWGVPSSYLHDEERFPRGTAEDPPGCPGLEDAGCIGGGSPSNTPLSPLTLDPTSCADLGHPAQLSVTTYQDPGMPTVAQTRYPQRTGCEQLTFNPSISVQPTTDAGYTSSGMDLDISDPQPQNPDVPSPSALEWTEVALPSGMALRPSTPGGRVECTDAQARLGSEEAAACPAGSRLGSASLEILGASPEPIPADVFLGTPWPEGQMRILVIAAGSALSLKLPGLIEEEAPSGRPIVFLPLPELPIRRYHVHLAGGEGDLFRTPVHCGSYKAEALFAPLDEALPLEEAYLSFSIVSGPGGGPCIGPAKAAAVRVDPNSIPADGHSEAKVTVAVGDANGTPVPADRITIGSSDPGQRIGKVTDNEDGTYSALLTGSTTPGTSTITATDLSVSPAVSGSATLTQLGAGVKWHPPHHHLAVRLLRNPGRRTTHRRVRFAFRANPPNAGFICRFDRSRFRSCRSPLS